MNPNKKSPSDSIHWHHHDAISIHKTHLNQIFSQKSESEQEVFTAFKEKANQGLAKAQFLTGLCYEEGRGTPQSYKSAFHYYKLAADQGYLAAQVSLALLYEDGLGTNQDYHQAIYYYKLAADQGNPSAQAQLGNFYAEGKGITKSPQEAIRYYQMAAEKGNLNALNYWQKLMRKELELKNPKKKLAFIVKRDFIIIRKRRMQEMRKHKRRWDGFLKMEKVLKNR